MLRAPQNSLHCLFGIMHTCHCCTLSACAATMLLLCRASEAATSQVIRRLTNGRGGVENVVLLDQSLAQLQRAQRLHQVLCTLALD